MKSKVAENTVALKSYIASMNCAIAKAETGSDVEDMYFLGKLEDMARRLGYKIERKSSD